MDTFKQRLGRGSSAVLVSAALVLAIAATSPAAAMAQTTDACAATGQETVATDKDRYATQEAVTLTGTGYSPECRVTVDVVRPDGSVVRGDGSEMPGGDSVTTAADGTFTHQYQLGTMTGTYTVNVISADNQLLATTTFEDSADVQELRLGGAAGPLNRAFTAGDTIYAKGQVDGSRHYRFRVLDGSGGVQRVSSCVGPTLGTTQVNDSYVVQADDPVSGTNSQAWRYELQQFTTMARCNAGTPVDSTDSMEFRLAKATAFSSAALTTGKSFFKAGDTAFMVATGVHPGQALRVHWVKPDGTVCSQTTSSSSWASSSSSGRLPSATSGSSSYEQYPPSTTTTGVAAWNRTTAYTSPATNCPAFSSTNQGQWKMRVEFFGRSGVDVETVDLAAFTVDATAPTTTDNVPTSWQNQNVVVTLSATDNAGGSGVDKTYYTTGTDPADPTTSSAVYDPANKPTLGHGEKIKYFSVDTAGNQEAVKTSAAAKVDTVAPAPTVSSPAEGAELNDATPGVSGTAGDQAEDADHSADGQDVAVKIYAGSSATGTPVREFSVQRTGGSWSLADADWDASVPARAPLADGTYTVRVEQSDAAGNTGESNTRTFKVDTVAPSPTVSSPANGAELNDATPAVSGTAGNQAADDSHSADGQNVAVKIYAGSSASGSPVREFSVARSGASWSLADADWDASVPARAPLADGTYTVRVEQSDAAGNTGQSNTRTFKVDTVAPSPTVSSPANGAELNDATPAISGTAGDQAADDSHSADGQNVAVKIYAGSSATGTPVREFSVARTGASWSLADADWDASVPARAPLADGTYTVRVEQSDGAGNSGQSNTRTFKVDTVAPSPTVSSPADGAELNDATPGISGSAGDQAADDSHSADGQNVAVKIYAGSSATGTPVREFSLARTGTSWSLADADWDGSIPARAPLADGTYTVQVEQSDGAGNTGQSNTRTFKVDTVAPSPTVSSPAEGAELNDATPAVSGTAGDQAADDSHSADGQNVAVKIYAGSSATGSPVREFSVARSGASWSLADAAWDASVPARAPLADGTYTVRVEQSDGAGNTGQSNTRTFKVDTVAPSPTVSSPADGAELNDATPAVSGTAGNQAADDSHSADGQNVAVKIYAGSSATGTPVREFSVARTGTSWSLADADWDASVPARAPLADGTYTVRVEQSDVAGNTGQSNTRTFKVDTVAPSPTVSSPADGAELNDPTPGISGTAGDQAADDSHSADGQNVAVKIYAGSSATGTPVREFSLARTGTSWSLADADWDEIVAARAPLGDGTYTVQAEQSDGAGNTGSSNARTFKVDTVPAVTEPADQTADEGEDKSFDLGSFDDPGVMKDEWTVDVDWGDGSSDDSFEVNAEGALGSRNHTYADNDTYTVTVTVTDEDGSQDSATFDVVVANVAPGVTAAEPQEVDQGDPLVVEPAATFTDPGFKFGSKDETFTATIDWGDGSSETVEPTWVSGSRGDPNAVPPTPNAATTGSVDGSHTYADHGEYTVTVEVCDDDGDCGSGIFQVTVAPKAGSNAPTNHALLANYDLEISGSMHNVYGDIHSNRNVKISGSKGVICGNITAVGTVRNSGRQCPEFTTTPGAAPVTLPNMADFVPSTAAATHTLTGDRTLDGYSCGLSGGCIVWIKGGKLEIRGTVTGKVWFLVDKEAIVKGNFKPANADSRIQVYSLLNVEIPGSRVGVEGVFLAERELKMSGSDQTHVGLFWAKSLVDISGSRNSVTGGVISNGLLKVSGSNGRITYDAAVIGLEPAA